MNTVPFDKLGPGQSGRHVYQVLGQDGPVHNSDNIRYLSPDSPEIPGQHADGSPKDAIAVGLTDALCAAPPVALLAALGIGIAGVGLGIWLSSKEEATPPMPVEGALSVSEHLDQLEGDIDAIRQNQGEMQEILNRLSLPKAA